MWSGHTAVVNPNHEATSVRQHFSFLQFHTYSGILKPYSCSKSLHWEKKNYARNVNVYLEDYTISFSLLHVGVSITNMY